jgi:hypothetical protein
MQKRTEIFHVLNTDFTGNFIINDDGSIAKPSVNSEKVFMSVPYGRPELFDTITKGKLSMKDADFESFAFHWNKYLERFHMTFGEVLINLQKLLNPSLDNTYLMNAHYRNMYYLLTRVGLFKYCNVELPTLVNHQDKIAEKYLVFQHEDFKFELAFKVGAFSERRKLSTRLAN